MIKFIRNINQYFKKIKFTKWEKKKILKDGTLFNAFDKTKTIFIHIPKTAGISIIKSVYGDVSLGGHRSMHFYSKIFDFNKDKYFSFCFVRNPYDRLYSSYKFLQKGGINQHDKNAFSMYIEKYKNFEDFVINGLDVQMIYEITHLVPQSKFICDKNRKILVDFIGKFENLENDVLSLSKKMKKNISLEHHNSNLGKQNYLEVYTPEMIKKVKNIYKTDFEILGYN